MGTGHGHDRNPAAHAHESEPIMTWPLVILAVCSIFSGWTLAIGLPFGTPLLEDMLEYGEPYRAIDIQAQHHYFALGASLLIMLSGIGLALLYYAPPGFPYFVPTRFSAAQTAERLGGVYRFLVHKWYFDELYWAVFVRPCMAIARFCHQIDKVLIDGLIDGAAATTAALSRFEGRFRHDRRRSACESDRQGRLYRRRLEPFDPDRPVAQLLDVSGRRAGGAVHRGLRLDPQLEVLCSKLASPPGRTCFHDREFSYGLSANAYSLPSEPVTAPC